MTDVVNIINTEPEIIVPVYVGTIIINTVLGQAMYQNRNYRNTIVYDLSTIAYQKVPDQDRYIRKTNITRMADNNTTVWPEHPISVDGKIQGAIVIIESNDGKILLVRNGNLWGLPKGARNYISYLYCKHLTDTYYRSTGLVLYHPMLICDDNTIETPEANARREVLEETGIAIEYKNLRSIGKGEQTNCYCSYDAFCYKYPYPACHHEMDLENNGTDHENDELLWVTNDELNDMVRNHSRVRIFNHITYGLLKSNWR